MRWFDPRISRKFGFEAPRHPDRLMEIVRTASEVYGTLEPKA